MANIKIPQLGSAQSIADTDHIVIDDGLNTLKSTAKQLKDYTNEEIKEEISDEWEEGESYEKGDIVQWNDELYKCKLAHQASVELTPINSTYWSPTKIGKELKIEEERGTITINTVNGLTFAPTLNMIKKWGRFVQLRLQGNILKCSANTDYIIANVPEGFRPENNGGLMRKSIFGSINGDLINGVGTDGGIYTISCSGSGDIRFRSSTGPSQNDGKHFILFEGTYIARE